MRHRGPAEIHANLTPMIDVTFLLIVFFVLVSQIVEVENVDLALPELPEPESTLPGEDQRVVVNVVPALGGAALAYRTGGVSYPAEDGGAAALGAALELRFDAAPNLRVSFRADRTTTFAGIRPALDAISDAARRSGVTPRLNLVVLREEGP